MAIEGVEKHVASTSHFLVDDSCIIDRSISMWCDQHTRAERVYYEIHFIYRDA